ncbi:MAG: hypothetical protein AB7P17_03915 [Nitrospirales bacterium]
MISLFVIKERSNLLGKVNRSGLVSHGSVLSLVMTVFVLIGTARGCAEMGEADMKAVSSAPQSFSIYALSRGTGVPKEASKVLEEARSLLKKAQDQGAVSRLIDRRIGLEGETRLCAEFKDPNVSGEIFSHIQTISQGVDLLNVKIESCSQ